MASTLMGRNQFIVWINDREARVLRMQEEVHLESTIQAPDSQDIPEQAASNDGTSEPALGFFHQVARALDSAEEILIVGPSATKLALVKYMHQNNHAFDSRIVGIETVEDPDSGRVAAYARLYFTAGGPRRSEHGSGYSGSE